MSPSAPRRCGWLLLLLVGVPACAPGRAEDLSVPPAPEPVRPCAPARLPEAPHTALTMERAVQVALERNPDIGMAKARIQAACASLAGARASRNPRVTGDVSVLGGDAPSWYLMKRIDARTLSPTTDFNDPGAFWNLEVGATLRYNLWDGGRSRYGICAAEAGVGVARSGRRAVENELAAAVASTFLQARAAEELLAADEASVRTVEAQVDETRVRVDQGAVLRSDLLSLEVRLAEAEERRIRTDVARRTALAGLRQLLALPSKADIRLVRGDLLGNDLPPDAENALVEAYRKRAELRATRQAVKQGRLGVERARRGNMPRVDLEARAYGDDEGLELSANYYVLLGVSFDLWDGGRTAANVMQARALVGRLEEEDRKTVLMVANDVETSYLQLEEARARLAVAGKAVGAADESLELVEAQYRAGAATITRFLEAEGARTRAHTRRIRAELDLKRAVVNARRALGRLGRRPTCDPVRRSS